MNKECEIVQDLLFGYQDGTLHMASKELVEEHLDNCEECKKVFSEMAKDEIEIDEKEEQEQEIDYLKKVNKKMSKKNKLLMIIGTILGIVILLNVGIFVYYYNEAGKIEIYLNDDIAQEQMESIENTILKIDENVSFKYYSKEDALNQMKEKFGDNKYLLADYGNNNNPFNAYYFVDTNIEKAKDIENMLTSMQGIKKITGLYDTNPYLFIFSKMIS